MGFIHGEPACFSFWHVPVPQLPCNLQSIFICKRHAVILKEFDHLDDADELLTLLISAMLWLVIHQKIDDLLQIFLDEFITDSLSDNISSHHIHA